VILGVTVNETRVFNAEIYCKKDADRRTITKTFCHLQYPLIHQNIIAEMYINT